MSNIAFIYQPHYLSRKFRVAMRDQTGDTYNYIVVTCSPGYNGVYRYDASQRNKYERWSNKNVLCVCVPIEDCEKIGELTDIKKPKVLDKVKSQQRHWYNNQIKNRDYEYVDKPEWILE